MKKLHSILNESRSDKQGDECEFKNMAFRGTWNLSVEIIWTFLNCRDRVLFHIFLGNTDLFVRFRQDKMSNKIDAISIRVYCSTLCQLKPSLLIVFSVLKAVLFVCLAQITQCFRLSISPNRETRGYAWGMWMIKDGLCEGAVISEANPLCSPKCFRV